MIGRPYRFRSRRAQTARDWALLIVAGLTLGAMFGFFI